MSSTNVSGSGKTDSTPDSNNNNNSRHKQPAFESPVPTKVMFDIGQAYAVELGHLQSLSHRQILESLLQPQTPLDNRSKNSLLGKTVRSRVATRLAIVQMSSTYFTKVNPMEMWW